MSDAPSSRPYNSYDLLKVIALLAMTVDHAGYYLFPHAEWLRVIGRAAAPIFCFLAGYNGSYRFRSELLVAAIGVTLADMLLGPNVLPFNILWTILLLRVVLQWLERRNVRAAVLLIAAIVWLPVTSVLVEYGSLGLIWGLWGRAERRQSANAPLYAAAGIIGGVVLNWSFFPFTLLQRVAVVLIFLLLYAVLRRFRLRPLAPLPGAAFLSRWALAYYVVHKVLLMAVARLIA